MKADRQTLLDFIVTAREVDKYLDKYLYSRGRLSVVKMFVLHYLRDNGKAKLGELAVATGTQRHNITTLAQRMERDKLITLKKNRRDRRVILAQLTRNGREIADLADVALDEAAAEVINKMLRERGWRKSPRKSV